MRTVEDRLALLEEMMVQAADRELILRTPDDLPLDGRMLSLSGSPTLNFASCSYLGLELDPRLQAGVIDAVKKYGTQFSSSRTYVQAAPYVELEAQLAELFGGPALVVPSTSLGHVAALPVLIGSDDAVIVDQQVHHSVQMAVNHLRAQGSAVEMIRHSNLEELDAAIARHAGRRQVWYLLDGVYSMFADLAPFEELERRLAAHEQLRLYIDDSHGVGWHGRHGRGPALERFAGEERVVVAASLNKCFAASGAAIVFGQEELKRRVRLLGGPMIFSGPIQPPMLGAALASVKVYLSDDLAPLQAALQERIAYCNGLLQEFDLPLASTDQTPIRFISIGLPQAAMEVTKRLLHAGFYTNIATFPAVPVKQSGVRFTLTLHHEPADIARLIEALARNVREEDRVAARALGPAGASRPTPPRRALQIAHHTSIEEVDPGEWDRLLGHRGTFSAEGLRFLERAFGRAERPEDDWSFHFYLVRDGEGVPVLATWFTEALWKDDMLSPAAVSALVERRRREQPYYLTSRTFAMGSLLTEGDHLYLDRDRDWRGALRLLIEAIGQHAASAGAASLVLRDIDADDAELGETLRDSGFVRIAMPDSFLIDPLPRTDEEWLVGLSQRARALQRREVLAREPMFEVEFVGRGGRTLSDAELAHLHRLYRNVRERSLELNAFELPRTLLGDMLAQDCWELMLLRLRDGSAADGQVVAFGAHFVAEGHYVPMLVGLDYDYVRSHGVYRQAIRQAMLRARALGAQRISLGMGAALEKQRFGARPQSKVAYVQTGDHYSAEVLADLHAAAMSAAA